MSVFLFLYVCVWFLAPIPQGSPQSAADRHQEQRWDHLWCHSCSLPPLGMGLRTRLQLSPSFLGFFLHLPSLPQGFSPKRDKEVTCRRIPPSKSVLGHAPAAVCASGQVGGLRRFMARGSLKLLHNRAWQDGGSWWDGVLNPGTSLL